MPHDLEDFARLAEAALRRKRRRRLFGLRLTDVALSVALLALAAVSGAFPFYVNSYPDQFSPPRMEFRGAPSFVAGDPEDRAPRFKEVVSGLVLPELDTVITGTPRRPGTPPGTPNEPGPVQSFPGGGPSLSILRAIDGRAIIVDGGVINIVRRNSELSDGSRVIDIRFNGEAWEVETSSGQVITWTPGAS